MLLEYIASKLSRVRWLSNANQTATNNENSLLYFLSGTFDSESKNHVSLWSIETSADEIIEFKCKSKQTIIGDVTQIVNTSQRHSFVTSSNGDCYVYNINENCDQLKVKHKWDSVDPYTITDAAFMSHNGSMVVTGKSGCLTFLNLSHTSAPPIKTKNLCKSSLECIELLSSNQILAGNEAGHIKLYDVRSKSIVLSLGGQFISCITCLRKNPSNSHIVASANENGVLSLWDLRNNNSHILQLTAHHGLINELQYKENEVNAILTAANDGQLLKWSLNSTSTFERVDAILSSGGEGDYKGIDSPINTFHLNSNDDILIASESEVLYYGKI